MTINRYLDNSISSIEVLHKSGHLDRYEIGGEFPTSMDAAHKVATIKGLNCNDELTAITLWLDDGTYSAIRAPADAQVKVTSI